MGREDMVGKKKGGGKRMERGGFGRKGRGKVERWVVIGEKRVVRLVGDDIFVGGLEEMLV